MELDWRGKLILQKLEEGCTIREAAAAVGITRQVVLKRKNSSPAFAQAVAAARETGEDERTFRLWLRHPMRGKRPPTGKGHGGAPQFAFGRRERTRGSSNDRLISTTLQKPPITIIMIPMPALACLLGNCWNPATPPAGA